jgi:Helix-turn-helix domain
VAAAIASLITAGTGAFEAEKTSEHALGKSPEAFIVSRYCPRKCGRIREAIMAEAEKQGRALHRAMSIVQFSEHYGVGRTKAYEELKSGRLRGRKIGKRTIITEDDAEDWLRRLPTIPPASSPA